jgi:hypothetical protein
LGANFNDHGTGGCVTVVDTQWGLSGTVTIQSQVAGWSHGGVYTGMIIYVTNCYLTVLHCRATG